MIPRFFLLTSLSFLFLAACGTSVPPTATQPTQMAPTQSMLSIVNEQRQAKGLPALRQSAKLTKAAQAHAQDMASRNFFSHTGSNSSRLGDRVKKTGYSFCYTAENIAKGQNTLIEVTQGWLASPGHRKNILSPKAQEMGSAKVLSQTGPYWVQVFGSPC